jgi:hypothetical protein
MKQLILLLTAMNLFGADFIPNTQMHVVLQPSKNLVWQDDTPSSERQMSYKSAMAYCETLDYIGVTNWRIPNTVELYTLIDPNRTPTISSAFAHTSSGCYWTLHDSMKGRVGIIDFSNGMKKSSQGFEQMCRVRCVSNLK